MWREKVQQPRKGQVVSEINVTPLVDVMLVLLVIFMVTAPMLQQGIDINLPTAKGKEQPSKEKEITVTVKKDGQVYLNNKKTNIEGLRKDLAGATDKTVYLKADEAVSYGYVAEIMGELKDIGIAKLGIVTLPKTQ
jgi:biopolymer transport protein TolR